MIHSYEHMDHVPCEILTLTSLRELCLIFSVLMSLCHTLLTYANMCNASSVFFLYKFYKSAVIQRCSFLSSLSNEERNLVKSGRDELRLFLFEFTEHRVFNVSILFVIFLNTIFIGLQTSKEIIAKSGV